MKWEYLREEEFKGAIERSGGLCIMVVGCLEKHGQHLPVGTDSLKGDKIAELAAEKADVMMFPTTMWLGDVSSNHAMQNPAKYRQYGYICMSTETLLTILEELCDEIARNGFKKILLLGSHGGNGPLLQYFQRSQLYKKKDYITMVGKAYDFAKQLQPANIAKVARENPEYLPMITEEDLKTLDRYAETGTGGGHGDFKETMLVQGTYPELVREDKFDAEDGHNCRGRYKSIPGVNAHLIDWYANCPNAFDGFPPFGCTKTIGEAAVKMSVDRLSDILIQLKNDDTGVEVIRELQEQ